MKRQTMIILLSMALLLAACTSPAVEGTTPEPCPTLEPCAAVEPLACPACEEPEVEPVEVSHGPTTVSGSFEYSNDFVIETYYIEHAVGLDDLTGFILRDEEWELPVESQALGYLEVDEENNTAAFKLNLPAKPTATYNDVDNDGQVDQGLQIFALSYSPNLYGGPFAVGDDRTMGWPSYLTSIETDRENEDEIIGGKLIIWSPDNEQGFPTGFGPDGMLFTEDDPTAPVPMGYTVVDLDADPFEFSQETDQEFTLLEPEDVAIKDYTEMSYTEAFDNMLEFLRKNYAFNGIEGKQPDWDALYAELAPQVQAAEENGDFEAYFRAVWAFTWAFNDGHVGMNDPQDIFYQDFLADVQGGYGFAMRRMDDGNYTVMYLLEDGPAAEAGMQIGAVITNWNGEPTADAARLIKPYSLPHSSDFALEYQQARYLLRAHIGDEAEVTFANPGESPQTVTLTAINEIESYNVTSVYANAEESLLPVEYKYLDSGVGYIKIASNYDDLNLIIRLFERALETFEAAAVPGIIIDMRFNSGGAPLGLAGFLHDEEIIMGQLQYYSEATGEFEDEGPPEKVYPNENQYRFDKMALLVGQSCFSACEIEAYGFSQVPGMTVVGMYPTGGVEAEVARGQFELPDGVTAQFPTGRFVLPDGSIFLEGQGVQPTLRVPITLETTTADTDVELEYAERAVLLPPGAGITPSSPPVLADPADAEAAVLSVDWMDDLAREAYTEEERNTPGATLTYTVSLGASQQVAWVEGWCAVDQATLDQNFEHLQYQFFVEEREISENELAVSVFTTQDGSICRLVYTVLDDWAAGEHHLKIIRTIDAPINDGIAAEDLPAGTTIYAHTVYVKP